MYIVFRKGKRHLGIAAIHKDKNEAARLMHHKRQYGENGIASGSYKYAIAWVEVPDDTEFA